MEENFVLHTEGNSGQHDPEVKKVKPFIIGALGYPLQELCWRGRTHISMAIAGGAGAAMLHRVSPMRLPLWRKTLLCGAGITGIEAVCGLVWNRRHQVWDYRCLPLNWRGQVCLPYFILWCCLSALWITAEAQLTSPQASSPEPLPRPVPADMPPA